MPFSTEQAGTIAQPAEAKNGYGLGFSSNHARVNGVSLHYLQKGKGQTVIFLHGFPYFSGAWYKLMAPLSECYQTIAPDNRGFGLSDKPVEVASYKLDILIEDLRQFIEHLNLERSPILIGHDWGGVISWAFTQKYPQLIDKQVIINAPPFNVFLDMLQTSAVQQEASKYVAFIKSPLSEWLFWFKGPDMLWSDRLESMLSEGTLSVGYKQAYMAAWGTPGAAKGAVNWYRANVPDFDQISEADYWHHDRKSVSIPTLLIWSKHDPAFVADTFNAITTSQPKLHLKVLDTDSHAPFLDEEAEVLKAVNGFLVKECPGS